MNTCVYEHRCRRTQKSFSFPLIILKTHTIREYLLCHVGAKILKAFYLNFMLCVFLFFDALRASSHPPPLTRMNLKAREKAENWKWVEAGRRWNEFEIPGVNGCVWISLHLLLRSVNFRSSDSHTTHAMLIHPCSTAVKASEKWCRESEALFLVHFNLRLIFKGEAFNVDGWLSLSRFWVNCKKRGKKKRNQEVEEESHRKPFLSFE